MTTRYYEYKSNYMNDWTSVPPGEHCGNFTDRPMELATGDELGEDVDLERTVAGGKTRAPAGESEEITGKAGRF